MDYSQMSEEELTQILKLKDERLNHLIGQVKEIQKEVLTISKEIIEISELENSPSTGL